MRRFWTILCLVTLLIVAALSGKTVPAHGASVAKQSCKTVTKKVHGKSKKVKVCHTVKAAPKPKATRTSTPTSTPTATNTPIPTNTPTPRPTATALPTATNTPVAALGEVSGSAVNLNKVLGLGLIVDPSEFCCFSDSTQTFLAPAHFQVDWSVTCQAASLELTPGFPLHALFSVVGYDGTYQGEVLYTARQAGPQSGTTYIDSSAEKRWAFVVDWAQEQNCSYHLVAKRLPA
jgi:hypothetical protein